MRGLLRSQYQQQKWTEAVENAKELVAQKGSSADDKALSNMAIGKSAQIRGEYDVAINSFKSVVAVNKVWLRDNVDPLNKYSQFPYWHLLPKLKLEIFGPSYSAN